MNNIHFKIGQPNTGKSHGFKKENLQDNFLSQYIEYKIIPVSGGVGNEYKGLQNTDLALSFDSINKTIRFGEFLQMLMSAIIQPETPHIVFLDDFHNQDISSLLSEYTPLFKSQQKVDLKDHTGFIQSKTKELKLSEDVNFKSVDKFITRWNEFITELKEKENSIVTVPVTNRISGSDLQLIFPANFYLFGAANFNEKTLNIFADWNDRAEIEMIDPIKVQEKFFQIKKDSNSGNVTKIIFNGKELDEGEIGFTKCCLTMNENLKTILHEEHIFDYQKYCFGIWKVIDENDKIISGKDNRVKTIKFFFSMIKNSLIYNNKNSYINNIGLKLIQSMENDTWFKNVVSEDVIKKIKSLDVEENSDNSEIFQLLHSLNIYDN